MSVKTHLSAKDAEFLYRAIEELEGDRGCLTRNTKVVTVIDGKEIGGIDFAEAYFEASLRIHTALAMLRHALGIEDLNEV